MTAGEPGRQAGQNTSGRLVQTEKEQPLFGAEILGLGGARGRDRGLVGDAHAELQH